jgi:hypothetical protein
MLMIGLVANRSSANLEECLLGVKNAITSW